MKDEKENPNKIENSDNQTEKKQSGFVFSRSVNHVFNIALKEYGEDNPVSSLRLTKEILRLHAKDYVSREFEKNIAEFFSISDDVNFQKKKIKDWMAGIPSVLDREIISGTSDFEIHGKLFILCLCELDTELKSLLLKSGILGEIKQKTTPPFDSLIKGVPDKRLILYDNPVFEDALGRNSFARAICIWLDNNWSMKPSLKENSYDSKSFAMHMGGPWGSGKSTMLNLIDKGFKCKDPKMAVKLNEERLDVSGEWVTVWFNAWRNQHFDQAWWPLMNTIIKEASLSLKQQYYKPIKYLWISFKEKIWRFFIGKIWYFIAFLLSITVLFFLYHWTQSATKDSDSVFAFLEYEKVIKAVGTILGLFSTIWTGILFFNNSLISGSSASAKSFIHQVKDPLEKVKKHFKNFIYSFEKHNHPVLVYIDDLDRCNPGYVVDLLESIQTIFTHRALYFIVAADRRWLYHSFETKYSTFQDKITELGKRMGYLFLEKAIQVSVTVPRMDQTINKNFMDYLYKVQSEDTQKELKSRKAKFKEEIDKIKDDKKLSEFIKRHGKDQMDKQVLRELAIEKSATKELTETTKYFLREFTHLLEQNPRAVKRFINTYNINKTLAYTVDESLIDTIEKKKQFALWTIVSIRWPLLAEMLEQEPAKVEEIKIGKKNEKVDKWSPFINNQLVKNVVSGKSINVELNEDDIKKLCRINPIINSASLGNNI